MSATVALEGRVAVVTGGAGGLGAGISASLAGAGAHVVIADLDPDALAATVDHVTGLGGTATGLVTDVRDDAAVARLGAVASEVGDGAVDVLVNNVGDYRPGGGRFLRSTAATWQALYEVNLHHVFTCTHAIAPGMVARGSGSIVNVSTVEASRGAPANAVYSAFNAGVEAFTASMAVELGRDGVRVNAVAPDLCESAQRPREAMLRGRDPQMVRHWVPLARLGRPDDVGDVVLFLASDLSRFVTGQVIAVDGGTSAAAGWYLRSDGRGWTNTPDQP